MKRNLGGVGVKVVVEIFQHEPRGATFVVNNVLASAREVFQSTIEGTRILKDFRLHSRSGRISIGYDGADVEEVYPRLEMAILHAMPGARVRSIEKPGHHLVLEEGDVNESLQGETSEPLYEERMRSERSEDSEELVSPP